MSHSHVEKGITAKSQHTQEGVNTKPCSYCCKFHRKIGEEPEISSVEHDKSLTRNLPTIVGPGPNLSLHNPDKRRGKATPGRSGAGPVRTRIEVAGISQQPWSTRNRTIPNPNPDPIKPNRIRFDPEPDRSRVKKTTNLIVRHRN